MKVNIFPLLSHPATMTIAAGWHVSTSGDNQNPGTAVALSRTIQGAAEVAKFGDTITVDEGIYRQRVNPLRGDESAQKRFVYRAAPGDRVEIKGSEVVKGWTSERDGVWRAVLGNYFSGNFDPYQALVEGDWFDLKGREHHTGSDNNLFLSPIFRGRSQGLAVVDNLFAISTTNIKHGNAMPGLFLEERDGAVYLHTTLDREAKPETALVTTERLGKTKVANMGFENPDGTPLVIDTDYCGNRRKATEPTPGPFENPGQGRVIRKVWLPLRKKSGCESRRAADETN